MYYQPRKIVGQQVASEADKNTRKLHLKPRLFLGDSRLGKIECATGIKLEKKHVSCGKISEVLIISKQFQRRDHHNGTVEGASDD